MDWSMISTDKADLLHHLGSGQKVVYLKDYIFVCIYQLFIIEGLESLMMIDEAYKMMKNINTIVGSHNYPDSQHPNMEELRVYYRVHCMNLSFIILGESKAKVMVKNGL